MRFDERRCITGSKLVRRGDNLEWFLRRAPVGRSSGPHRASQDLRRRPPYDILSGDHVNYLLHIAPLTMRQASV